MLRMTYRVGATLVVCALVAACGGRTPTQTGDGGIPPIKDTGWTWDKGWQKDGPWDWDQGWPNPDWGWPQPDWGPPPPPLDGGWPPPPPSDVFPSIDLIQPDGQSWLPNLTATAFYTKIYPKPGGADVEYVLTYCNTGKGDPMLGIYIGLYYNPPTMPYPGLKADQETKVPSLKPGACNTVTFKRTNVPVGTKNTSWIFIDSATVINESNEADNLRNTTFSLGGIIPPDAGPPPPPKDLGSWPDKWTPKPDWGVPWPDTGVPLPDLIVKNVTASAGFGAAGGVVTYNAIVCNIGPGFAGLSGSVTVGLYYNRNGAPTSNIKPDQEQKVKPMPTGACQTLTFTRPNTPAGSYLSWIFVDNNNYETELNENNNTSSVKVDVKPPAQAPDLTIKDFSYQVYGSSTTTVSYRFTVCNNGSLPSPTTQLYVYYDRSAAPKVGELGDKYTTVYTLQPGQCQQRSISRSGTPPGTFTSWGQIDPQNSVAESNEGNNVAGPLTVNTGGSQNADLTIKSFTAQTGGSSFPYVRYNIEVCNVGTGTSSPTEVTAYFDRPSAPPASDYGDQLTTVNSLAAGKCQTRYIYRSSAPSGSYTSWARVDPLDGVKETNESNNDAGPVKVTVK